MSSSDDDDSSNTDDGSLEESTGVSRQSEEEEESDDDEEEEEEDDESDEEEDESEEASGGSEEQGQHASATETRADVTKGSDKASSVDEDEESAEASEGKATAIDTPAAIGTACNEATVGEEEEPEGDTEDDDATAVENPAKESNEASLEEEEGSDKDETFTEITDSDNKESEEGNAAVEATDTGGVEEDGGAAKLLAEQTEAVEDETTDNVVAGSDAEERGAKPDNDSAMESSADETPETGENMVESQIGITDDDESDRNHSGGAPKAYLNETALERTVEVAGEPAAVLSTVSLATDTDGNDEDDSEIKKSAIEHAEPSSGYVSQDEVPENQLREERLEDDDNDNGKTPSKVGHSFSGEGKEVEITTNRNNDEEVDTISDGIISEKDSLTGGERPEKIPAADEGDLADSLKDGTGWNYTSTGTTQIQQQTNALRELQCNPVQTRQPTLEREGVHRESAPIAPAEAAADLLKPTGEKNTESQGGQVGYPEHPIAAAIASAKGEDETRQVSKNKDDGEAGDEVEESEDEEDSEESAEEASSDEESEQEEDSAEEEDDDDDNDDDESTAKVSKKLSEMSVTPDDKIVDTVHVRKPETSVKFKASKFVSHRLGKLTEHYEVNDFLGQGGFGSVYAAKHKLTGTGRAVKEMKKSKENEEINKLILNEFQILKNLDHPNILRMYELFEDKRSFYIITEVCRGGELKEELSQCGRFTEEQTKKLMKQVLACVNYFHKQKIVHRDLKPGNILLEENKKLEHIKIIDFGMATYIEDGVKLTETMGTVAFMAPEVIGMSYSKECDLWSCGVIAFVVLSGEQPFKAPTTEETFNNIINGEYDFSSPAWVSISNEAKDFVEKLLTWDEGLRPTAEEALQHSWLDFDKSSRSLEGAHVTTAFNNLGSFQAGSRLKIAVCTFIASQLLDKDEKERLASVFRAIDINNDGSLDKEEVKLGYSKFFNRDLSDEEVDHIFNQVDADGTGELEYSEFVFGALGEKKLLSVENLKKAFQIFDKDQSGFISMDELREMLSCDESLDEEAITKIIAQVDTDGDGEVSFEEWLSIALPEVREMATKDKKDKSISLKFKANSFVAHRLGKLTDHYDVVDYIAKGSFGIVCSAMLKSTGALRAIKELKKSKKNESRNEQLLREFHILKGLDHPNILKMYELFEDKRHYYIVTEVCLGGDLHHELKKRGRFSEEDAALLLCEVLSCVNYFHKNKIVHRDLKPGNILLEESKRLDQLKVIDFGEAVICDFTIKLSDIAGTMSYMAPEVLGMSYAHKCDIWSVGVIAFLLLSGRQPLKGADDKETFQNIVANQWSFSDPVWESVSAEGKDFVKDLLTWDQNERPSAEEALQHLWLLEKNPRKSIEELKPTTVDALANLEGFDATSKLRLAVCTFIAGQLLDKKEKEKIDEVFNAIDLDKSGTLSKDEVKLGYCQYFGRVLSDEEIEAIFKNVDTSGSGEMDYSSFVMGALDKQALLNRQNLETAFRIFDVDSSGDITMEELKLMLHDALTNDPEMDDRAIAKLIKDVDTNGDGIISFDEFLAMAACPQRHDDGETKKTSQPSRTWQGSEDLLEGHSVRFTEPRLLPIAEDSMSMSMSDRSDQARTTTDSDIGDSIGQGEGNQGQRIITDSAEELKARILRAAEIHRAQGVRDDPPGFREVGSHRRVKLDAPSCHDEDFSDSLPSGRDDYQQSCQPAEKNEVTQNYDQNMAGMQRKLPDPRLTEAYDGFHRVQDKMRKLRLLLRAKNILDVKKIRSNLRSSDERQDELTVESLDDAFSKLVQLQSKMRSLQALVKANKI